mmetsp:Transcript_4353/g.9801  ORF Transcript_4353/g.9801 Transcript_4353/m.9801 type:complete len:99 (+) Transcript_4353:779-1075(+)
MSSMNFSGGKQYIRPPQRGIFPLDHDSECKAAMEVSEVNVLCGPGFHQQSDKTTPAALAEISRVSQRITRCPPQMPRFLQGVSTVSDGPSAHVKRKLG